MANEKQRKTFLSYSRANTGFAKKLVKELNAEGFSIWLDQLDIPTGKRWDVELEKALEECEIFMIIMTPDSVASENVRDEIGYAIDSGKRFLPILLEECVIPLRLRRFQYIDFSKVSFDEGLKSVEALLRKLNGQLATPNRTGETKVDLSAVQDAEKVPAEPTATMLKKPVSKWLVLGIASIVVLVLLGIGFGVFSEKASPMQPTENLETTTLDVPTPLVAFFVPVMEVGSSYSYVDGSTLLAVPEGPFTMGGDGSDSPTHELSLSDYWIYSTEVTNQQFALCVNLGLCIPPASESNPNFVDYQRANDPVTGVTYEQAANYCSFVNGRLPTEAEWEKAAQHKSGGDYPWGETAPSCDLLNFNNCTPGKTNVVNYSNGASSYGALDMAGNVFEWVADWYDVDYYINSPGDNPTGPETGINRSVRSSSYASATDQVALSMRSSEDPENQRPDLGFRCVVDDPVYFAPFCNAPTVYANAQNTNPSECPELGIKEVPFCADTFAQTNVIFSGPADATIDPKDCVPSDNPNLFTCQSLGTIVSINAQCQVDDVSGDPSCPAGYTRQADTCVADAASESSTCLSGNYDPATQCCNISENNLPLQICPVGSYYSASQNACLPYPVQELVTVSLEVSYMSSCESTGGGGGSGGGGSDGGSNSCDPAEKAACPVGCTSDGMGSYIETFWNPNLCACMTIKRSSCD